jgi:hypothetical protein
MNYQAGTNVTDWDTWLTVNSWFCDRNLIYWNKARIFENDRTMDRKSTSNLIRNWGKGWCTGTNGEKNSVEVSLSCWQHIKIDANICCNMFQQFKSFLTYSVLFKTRSVILQNIQLSKQKCTYPSCRYHLSYIITSPSQESLSE